MDQPITREQAIAALRKLAGAQGFNIEEAQRSYALVRQAMRSEEGRELSTDIETYVTTFSEEFSKPMIADIKGIQQMAWPVLEELYSSIRVNISDFQLAHDRDKRIHFFTLTEKLKTFQKKYDISHAYVSEENAQKHRELCLKDSFIPMAIIYENKALKEAIRREVFNEPKDEAQKALLFNGDGEYKEDVHSYLTMLLALGSEILVHPTGQIERDSSIGGKGFDKAFFQISKRLTDAETIEAYKTCSEHFSSARAGLHHLSGQMEEIRDHRQAQISQETWAELRAFHAHIKNALSGWEKHFEKKMNPEFNAALRIVSGCERSIKNAAENFWRLTPKPLGNDPLLKEHIDELGASLAVIEQHKGIVDLDSKEFLDFYNAMLALHERLCMPVFRVEILLQAAEALENGEVEGIPTLSPTLKKFIDAIVHIAKTIPDGHGDITHPSSPQSVRNRLGQLIETASEKLDPLDKAAFTFLRLEDPIDTLNQYALQEITRLTATTAAQQNLSATHTKAASKPQQK